MASLKELFPQDWVFSNEDIEGRDELIGKEIPYLNKGFVQLVDCMGDDMTIADGARTSFRSSSEEYSEARNRGLIRYLVEHKHTSPLELPSVQFRVKIPLFVRAQHVRHRTQSCNWESQRYQQPDGDFYIPPVERIRYQDKWNKQGSGGPLPQKDAQGIRAAYKGTCEQAWDSYKYLVDKVELSRETARDFLHPNFYSTGVFTMKLHNLFHYLKLRNDSHAQPEIRLFANTIEEIVEVLFPMAYDAWDEFDRGGTNLSASELDLVRQLFKDEPVVSLAKFIKENLNCFGSTRRRKSFVEKACPQLLEHEDCREIILESD